ncbi:hypothetical protein CTI12_AA135530 [Artemisia annua]|uniref:Uncharacterized protein n=1 Tax=Artemisia annua TaxID=35608 RepID=A0A2U1PMU7_ARTAN|nr:hypothetical protein CTI12_AA135530 [Artemisia annua]
MRVGSDQDSSKSKKMGVMERLEWMNTCSKKQCRSLFWRMRAAMKKAVKNKHTFFVALYGGTKKQFNFQYDPSSYALNFDDGTHDQHHHDHYFFHVGVSKGVMVESLTASMQTEGKPLDFMLVDEHDIKFSGEPGIIRDSRSICMYCWPKANMAKYYLDDTVDVIKMLNGFEAASGQVA